MNGRYKVWEEEWIGRTSGGMRRSGAVPVFCAGQHPVSHQYGTAIHKENLVLLDNAAFQHETALVKQVEAISRPCTALRFCGPEDIMDPEQLIRLVGRVLEKTKCVYPHGPGQPKGKLELMELGGKRYPGIDISEEEFFRQALARQD